MASDNYRRICEEIHETAIRYGRKPEELTLVAVTKSVDWKTANLLYAQGQRDFGENRVQQALEKHEQSPSDCRWHLIGSLQSNKVSKVIGKFTLIHSVDSPELAHKLSQESCKRDLITPILLQSNTSGEKAKHGLSPEQWKERFKEILNLPGISIEGLMTIAPFIDDESVIRKCFVRLRNLREELSVFADGRQRLLHLSMGMSHDFPFAIAEGATILRIGTALFS